MKLFSRKPPRPDPSETLLRELDARFRTIETTLNRLQDLGQGKTQHITIEHVHIHQPVLEKLEFRLDELDIEHLSGSLNLGNNFGAKINPLESASGKTSAPLKHSAPPASPVAMRPDSNSANAVTPPDSNDIALQRTKSGYRVTKS